MANGKAGLMTMVLVAGLSCAPADDLEANKQVVRAYMEQILNNGKFDTVDDLFPAEGFVLSGRALGKDEIRGLRLGLVAAFPDFLVTIEKQVAEGDLVVTRVTFSGTHEGEYAGIAPTGARVRWTGMAMDHVVDGKVVEGWHESDGSALLAQLREAAGEER